MIIPSTILLGVSWTRFSAPTIREFLPKWKVGECAERRGTEIEIERDERNKKSGPEIVSRRQHVRYRLQFRMRFSDITTHKRLHNRESDRRQRQSPLALTRLSFGLEKWRTPLLHLSHQAVVSRGTGCVGDGGGEGEGSVGGKFEIYVPKIFRTLRARYTPQQTNNLVRGVRQQNNYRIHLSID